MQLLNQNVLRPQMPIQQQQQQQQPQIDLFDFKKQQPQPATPLNSANNNKVII